jgi:ApaG protein
MFTSEATTRGVHVSVRSEYAAERSKPEAQQWFFLYTITITNQGAEPVQLVSRHWIITDADGHVEEVRGPGVVGQQPVLAPGEAFTYTSEMATPSGETFDAAISPFTLSEPYTVH